MTLTGTNNPIELLIGIRADTEGSQAGIQKQVDTLSKQLEGLNVDIKIDSEALKVFKDIAKVDFSKLLKGIDEIKQKAGDLSQTEVKEVQGAWDQAAKAMGVSFGKSFNIMETDAQKLKSSLEGLNGVVTLDKTVKDNHEQIKGMVMTVEKDGIKVMTRFKQTITDLGDGKKSIQWMPETIKETDSSFQTIYKSTAKFNEKLIELRREGKITEEQFKTLNAEVDKLGKRKDSKGLEDELTNINRKTAEYVITNKELATQQKKTAADKKKDDAEQATNIQKLIKLENDLIAARKRQPEKMGKNTEVDSIQTEIQKISSSSKIAGADVTDLENRFRRVKSEATEAGRSSMTFAESFKTAMEKFPVWMAASTVFYSTVRSIRDAFEKIIALDSQMTVMRRVAGDGADANKILEESVRLAGELGNEIADINEGFIAFARQGFRGDELTSMAEYATLLGNISDLSVEDSASVLTAGIKGFNIEAENSLRIVDALNEVNYVPPYTVMYM